MDASMFIRGDEMGGLHVDALHLDLVGLKCPLPVLRTRKALGSALLGARLVVETSDPVAVIDIPHLCHETGHKLISMQREGAYTQFVIEVGDLGKASAS